MEIERYTLPEKELNTLLGLNDSGLMDRERELKRKISDSLSGGRVEPIFAVETRQRFNQLSETEKMPFIRRLEEEKDWRTIQHILIKSAAFLGLSKEEYAEVWWIFAKGRYPYIVEEMEIVEALLKKRRPG